MFRGTDAVRVGVLSRSQLRGPAVRRLFQGVYSPAEVTQTHALYCTAAGLVLPPSAVITGRSAATLRGVRLARTEDPVEVLVPVESRVIRSSGLAVRRTAVRTDEWLPWSGMRLANGELWALNRDRERLNRVQAEGWEIVFVTAALLRDPQRMVRTVRAALARRA